MIKAKKPSAAAILKALRAKHAKRMKRYRAKLKASKSTEVISK